MFNVSFEAGVNSDLDKVKQIYSELNAEKVFVTWRPDEKFGSFVTACSELAKSNINVVPHIVARNLVSKVQLHTLLQFCNENSTITSALLLAGDKKNARGEYASTVDVLRTENLLNYGICTVCLAGYPQGHASIAANELEQHLSNKIMLAQNQNLDIEIVTQLVASLEIAVEWAERQVIAKSVRTRVSVPIGSYELIKNSLAKIYNESIYLHSMDNLDSPTQYLEISRDKLNQVENKVSIHLIPFHDIECLKKNTAAINTLLQSKLS